ncbi:MAG TPA: M23 family metallopeptidase [Candidatus Babeliaceae bacterium]|nr:M23 family metallopeptidase [Candidatus Babeliaceae bacterium]
MKLSYPLDEVHVNQAFGANAAYYKQNFGTEGHMGIDFRAPHGTPVKAAHDGFAFYVGPDSYGGDGVYIRAQDTDGSWYTTIYWHLIGKGDPLQPIVANAGANVKAGDTIGYADNTGAPFESSGDHLHFGLARCDENGEFLNKDNGFNGCIDPAPYLESLSASDQIAVLAARLQAQGKDVHILFALVKFLQAFGK